MNKVYVARMAVGERVRVQNARPIDQSNDFVAINTI